MYVGERVYVRSTTKAEFHAGTVTALGVHGRFQVAFDTRYRWVYDEETVAYTFNKPKGRDPSVTRIARQRFWYPAMAAASFKRGNPLEDDGKPVITGARLHV